MKKIGILIIASITLLILVSCTGSGLVKKSVTVDNMNVDQANNQPSIDDSAPTPDYISVQSESNQSEDRDRVDDPPAWQKSVLVDARSGESFTLSDFVGKQVFVEPMATWCTNCRRQLTNVQAAREQLGDETVFIAISVETNIDNTTLAKYADDAGFEWLFAVATPELLTELTAEFGRAIVNPPATPHFIIRVDGSYSELITGIDSAPEIISRLTSEVG